MTSPGSAAGRAWALPGALMLLVILPRPVARRGHPRALRKKAID